MRRCTILTLFIAALMPASFASADGWRAGVAKVDITPPKLMWMSGYAARKKPAEGKDLPLYAKALVLVDPQGNRGVLVTMDLIGIGRELSLEVRRRIEKSHGFERAQIVLSTSHTHSGPVVGRNLMSMYFLSDEQKRLVEDYADELKTTLTELVGAAVKDVSPCALSYGTGQATFAVNRRNNPADQVPRLREEGKLRGPFDHDVPVLKVMDEKGKLKAVVFGYACHATTLSYFRWNADYPGYAQRDIEASHEGAVALFWAGCGADQNPLPRRDVVLAEQYGRQLADAVNKVLAGQMKPIAGAFAAQYNEIDLKFHRLPTREELVKDTESSNVYIASRAKLLLEQVDGGRPLSPTYPYPVQTWRIGDEVLLISLGGEVVVDYALRLKKQLGAETTWVAGYCNDVMAYIPSLRVLREGGYEGEGAMVYYGRPSKWGESVEEDVVAEVARQVERLKAPR